MRPRKGKEESVAPTDEREWRDWWRLRDELGKRLGKRAPSVEIEPSLLKDERPASAKRGRRR